MTKKKNIPNKIELSATDPFLKYLGHMYNSGVEYLIQADDMINQMGEYQDKLDGYMKNSKLKFLLEDKK